MKNTRHYGKHLFLCLLLSSLVSQVLAAAPARTARTQIYNQAVASAQADISRVVTLKKWPTPQSKINVFIPSEAAQFPLCARPLSLVRPAADKPDLARMRYEFRCDGSNGWEVAVTVKADIYLPVLVARHTLERGRLLAASDLEIKKKNITGLRDGFLTTPDEAMGFTVKKRVRDMQPLSPSHLDQPILVERGQRVVMIAELDGVEARMLGEAQKKGRKGDTIKVKNLSSQQMVSAVVDGQGVVRLMTVPGR